MVYRHSWIVGFASIGFAFWHLTRLLLPTLSGAKWQLVVLSGLILGILITWTAITYRVGTLVVAGINLAVLFLAATRFAAPESTFLLFPTWTGITALGADLSRAFDVIRFSVEPVLPITGVVVIITALFWLLGAMLAWGLLKGHPFAALIPPLVVGIEFATIERQPSGPIMVAVFVTLVAASILAVNVDERDQGVGKMTRTTRRGPAGTSRLPATAIGLVVATVAVALLAVGGLHRYVPNNGVVTWRTPGGLTGDFFGSVSYNPFVSIQKGLAAQTPTPLFTARISGDVDPSSVYFTLVTLEDYRNGQWSARRPEVFPLDEGSWQNEELAYLGPTEQVEAAITIDGLAQDWLPAPYASVAVDATERKVFRVRRLDSTLNYRGAQTYRGMRYTVTAELPQLDRSAIATAADGQLSRLFATAADAETVPMPVADLPTRELEDPRYTELPTIDPRVTQKALEITANLDTDFDKGLALENWFRDPASGFVYDVEVEPGHGQETLSTFLFDNDTGNASYRRGYCEQFATSMGVMARSLGIPTRVVLGFTPGRAIGNSTVLVQDRNAHAWVELWIPSQGWVRFDPTPRSDGVNNPTSSDLTDILGFDATAYLARVEEPERPETEPGVARGPLFPNEDDASFIFPQPTGAVAGGGFGLADWVVYAIPLAVLIVLLGSGIPAVKWLRRRRRLRRLESGDVTAAWEQIVTRLTDLGEAPDVAATPLEVAGDVDEALTPLARVYSMAVYGQPGSIGDSHVLTATRSLETTEDHLNTRFSSRRRALAWYRLSWFTDLRRRGRGERSEG